MKLTTTADVHNTIIAFGASAALNTALELGLFWRLASEPETTEGIAQSLGVPLRRCRAWLELLVNMGLLERVEETYMISSVARTAILDAYSQTTWAWRAQARHAWYPAGVDLPANFQNPHAVRTIQGRQSPDEYRRLSEDPAWAAAFTRALYELHLPLANELAETLDMSGVQRMMDLGGGSGVISLELLRRYPQLTSVVIDQEQVCITGRAIAAENGLSERITYHPADFLRDDLPVGFDLVLECDVGIYEVALLRKVHAALHRQGRLVLVGLWAPEAGMSPVGQEIMTFLHTLQDPDFEFKVVTETEAILAAAGFKDFAVRTLSEGRYLVEVRKAG